jgi:hypothetical protein
MSFGPVTASAEHDEVVVRNDFFEVAFRRPEPAVSFRDALAFRCLPRAAALVSADEQLEVRIDDTVLVRIVHTGTLGRRLSFRITYDAFQSRNLHVYVRIEAIEDVEVSDLELPRLEFEGGSFGDSTAAGRWLDLGSLGLVVTKPPWHARWNDVGCYGHRVLGGADLRASGGSLSLAAPKPLSLRAGDTVESAFFLRPASGSLEAEAEYRHPDELRYVPEGERLHTLLWEAEDVWLGPPIFDGCPQRPYDQLIPRPLGLDVLARKRFTWNNEDFSLWRLTGKDSYWESGIKKAYALLATQNEYGGWFEGIEFYNLPPHHHHMYDTYISSLFLLEAYDLTGFDRFLEAAGRSKRFWLGEPPANSHTEEGPNAWWYRWGGYVNEFGYTDERRVLNTHAGATEFFALYFERTGDDEARLAMENGINGFKLGLERGIQKGNGQFLYCLSQVDPTLERPGDPPYLRLDLVPQIEDVYTVASRYRLLMANRIARDPAVTASIRKALDYWWDGYRKGQVYTYRAYAVIAYAVAAGEIDITYALALPELLKQPDHFTSMQRGLSSFVAPAGLPGLPVHVESLGPSFVEPVFVRRTRDEFTFALVNVEYPQQDLRVAVELPEGGVRDVVEIDPATRAEASREFSVDDGVVRFRVPELGEFGVTAVRLGLRSS